MLLDLKEEFLIDISKDDIIILDSCSNRKEHGISFHLIINKVVFQNNTKQKIYIDNLVEKINNDIKVSSIFNRFIDKTIYKPKSQNMRLINQSKASKLIQLKSIRKINISDSFVCSVLMII